MFLIIVLHKEIIIWYKLNVILYMNASDVGDGNFCSHIVGSIMTKEVPCITSLYEKIRMNKNAFSLIVVSEVKDNSNWCLTPYKLIQGLESLQ